MILIHRIFTCEFVTLIVKEKKVKITISITSAISRKNQGSSWSTSCTQLIPSIVHPLYFIVKESYKEVYMYEIVSIALPRWAALFRCTCDRRKMCHRVGKQKNVVPCSFFFRAKLTHMTTLLLSARIDYPLSTRQSR